MGNGSHQPPLAVIVLCPVASDLSRWRILPQQIVTAKSLFISRFVNLALSCPQHSNVPTLASITTSTAVMA
eukprot:scaffold108793_cov20-Prasinocladus_malaysianus.AAC.2